MMNDEQLNAAALATPLCDTPALRRRRFLTLASLGAMGVMWPTTTEAAIPVRMLAAPGLLAVLGSERAVQQLGECYRRLVPAENDATVLVQAILAPSPSILSSNLTAGLAEQVRDDFTHRRTVTVDGWILSLTEARQCALYSLVAA